MTKLGENGFTLPELITTIAVTAVFTSLILFFTISYWRYGALLEADLSTYVSRLNAGDILRESLSSSSGAIIQNSILDSNTNNPDPAIASNLYWLPLHSVPKNVPIGSVGSTTPLMYYKRFSINKSGALIYNGTQPFEDEFVLYLDGSTRELRLRTLANTAASNNRLLKSCPPNIATASCPADKTITNNINSINIRYFSKSGNLIDHNSVIDPITGQYIGPDLPTVEVVEFTLNITQKALFQKTTSTNSSTIIRMALRNT